MHSAPSVGSVNTALELHHDWSLYTRRLAGLLLILDNHVDPILTVQPRRRADEHGQTTALQAYTCAT